MAIPLLLGGTGWVPHTHKMSSVVLVAMVDSHFCFVWGSCG